MAKQTDGNDQAFATPPIYSDAFGLAVQEKGLSKREYFAAMAFQSLIPLMQNGLLYDKHDIAQDSVNFADALIEALNKEK